jgi:hypothetical protein
MFLDFKTRFLKVVVPITMMENAGNPIGIAGLRRRESSRRTWKS